MTGSAPAPLPLRVRLPFESEEAFIRRFGANVSASGIFIPTKTLKPEGTHLRFELVLADGTRLLRGGVVVQDAIEAAPGRRGGMELAFTELDAQSHAVLARILAARPETSEQAQGLGAPSWRRVPPATVSPSKPGTLAPSDASASTASPQASALTGSAGSLGTSPHPPGMDADPSTEKKTAATERSAAPLGAEPSGLSGPASPGSSEAPGVRPSGPEAQDAASLSSGERSASAPDIVAPATDEDLEEADARELAARHAAQLAQTRARAARVETLAQASAREADALVSRIRGATPTTVLAASIDFPEAGLARWRAGHLSLRDAPSVPDSAWALRLLGHPADAPRLLELAATEGREVHTDPDDGTARWEEDGQETDGAAWAARWIEGRAHAGEALAGDARPLWVLALPLHAGHRQRETWVAAAAHLGFERIRLTSSPIAAAVAYAHGKGFARRRLLVLSHGVVGFDAAIVQLTGDDVETLSAAGDPFLGLPELESRLAYALRRRLQDAGLTPAPPSSTEGVALREACAAARRALGQDATTSLTLTLPGHENAAGATHTLEVTREELDAVSQDLIERQLALVTEVLDEAQLSATGVDGVLVLGSVERSPLWKQRLSELLGRDLSSADEVDPASVIRGAALIGEVGVKAGSGRRPFSVSEVLSVPLAIAERSGRLRRVLERGTRLPLSKTLTLPVSAGQELGVLLYQGAGAALADAEPLGAIALHASLPGEVELRIRVDEDGRMEVTVEAPGVARVPLPKTPIDPVSRDALLAIAPEGVEEDARGSGLLGGLRRLFRKA